MLRAIPARPLLGLLMASALVSSASAQGVGEQRTIEPWADPDLKVQRGLALWLDAGRLNAARKVHGVADAGNGFTIHPILFPEGLIPRRPSSPKTWFPEDLVPRRLGVLRQGRRWNVHRGRAHIARRRSIG